MNDEQQAMKERIASALSEMERAKEAYLALKRQCQDHIFIQDGDSAVCAICAEDGGWWCPDSDIHVCTYEHGEYCIHCGAPEERK